MSEERKLDLDSLYKLLRAPLPAEAYETDSSRGFPLTGIKGAYVIERLNDVFGVCGSGWQFVVSYMEIRDGFVVADISLQYRVAGGWSAPIPASGDQRIIKGRVGDARKGAVTDALKKAASYLGVGHRAYKGLLPNSQPKRAAKTQQKNEIGNGHWIDRPEVRKRFWAWAKGTLQLSESEIYVVLDVEHIHDFTGTMRDAKALLETYAHDKSEPTEAET